MIRFCEVKGEVKDYMTKETKQQFLVIFSEMEFMPMKNLRIDSVICETNLNNHGNGATEYAVTHYHMGWWIFALKSETAICYYIMQPPHNLIELIAVEEL